MSVKRYIGDLHFGHRTAAQQAGFDDVESYNKFIVQQFNSVVGKRDMTYILGDVLFDKKYIPLLGELNGLKVVVLGNHDPYKYVDRYLQYCKVAGMLKYKHKEYGRIFITHCPIHPCEFNSEYRKPISYNIHGHTHGYEIQDKRYIKVCAEVIDYKPKILEELMYGRK